MPRILYLVLAIGFLAASGGLAWWSKHLEAGKVRDLAPDQDVNDLGEIPQGSYDADFNLVNNADVPLKVLEIVKSCDCANIELSSNIVAPSQRVKLRVHWNLKGRRDQTESELAVMYLKQGASDLEFIRLLLRANVLPDYRYDPLQLVYSPDRPGRITVKFRPEHLSTIRLRAAHSTHPAFQTCLRQEASEIEVSFDPQLWSGGQNGMHLIVETDSPNEPTCRVPLFVGNTLSFTKE